MFIYGTTTLFKSLCAPSDPALMKASGMDKLLDEGLGAMEKISSDIKDAGWVVGACIIVALVIGLVYMIFLRLFAGLLVFLTIVAYLFGLAVLGLLMMTKSTEKGSDGSD